MISTSWVLDVFLLLVDAILFALHTRMAGFQGHLKIDQSKYPISTLTSAEVQSSSRFARSW